MERDLTVYTKKLIRKFELNSFEKMEYRHFDRILLLPFGLYYHFGGVLPIEITESRFNIGNVVDRFRTTLP